MKTRLQRRCLRRAPSAAVRSSSPVVIFGLRSWMSRCSASACSTCFAVLPVAIVWGFAYAVGVAVSSMLAFNFFFLEPVHTFTLADSSNWFALVVFVVTAVVVSELAAGSRRRAQEAAAHAAAATALLDDRERLAQEALEAEALRRADAIKTALLRAVSHDLRTPLMAISTSAGALARHDLAIDEADRAELLDDDPRRVGPARPSRRQPARPLAAAGGSGAARSRSCVDARRPRRGRARRARRRRTARRGLASPTITATVRVDAQPDPARARRT